MSRTDSTAAAHAPAHYRDSVDTDRMRRLADNLPQAMIYQVVLEEDGTRRFTYVSRSVEQLHGVSVASVLADASVLYDQVLPAYLPALREAERETFRKRTPFRFELPYRRPDGKVRWSELNAVPIPLPDGRTAWDGLEIDITGRKQAEEALRQSEAEFRSFFETAVVGAAHVEAATGRFTRVNDQCCRITGYDREELLELTFLDITHPDDRAANWSRFDRLIRGECRDHGFDNRCVRKDGQVAWIRTCMTVDRGETGYPSRVSVVMQDITEQRLAQEQQERAEQALRHSEARFRAAYVHAPVGIQQLALDGTILDANQRLCQMLGYSRQELIGRTFEEITHPEDRVIESLELARLMSGQAASYKIEKRYLHRSGHAIWVRVTSSLTGEPGRPGVRRISVIEDISESRVREQALRESEANLRTLADNITQLAWMTDETGCIFWYNSRWYDYTGAKPDEVQGWGWRRVHHPDHVERVIERFKRCIQEGTIWEDTFPLRGKDGQYRWFLTRAVPIRDESGKVFRWFGTNTDVTELREAQERLQESRRLYRSRLAELQTIYRSAPIGLCVVDQDLRYARMNDRLAQMNGLPAADHVGRTVREIVPDLADAQETALKNVLRTGEPVIDLELSGCTRAMPGIVRHWLMSCYPIPNDAGETVGVNVTVQEITDRKRAEQERQQLLEAEQVARSELERYNRLKDEFLATVSHELRSPLNAILGWTRLLVQGKAETARALEIVERNASGLAQLVEDLLDMSRIISGKIRLERTQADLGPLISSVMDSLQLAAQAKGITLTGRIAPRLCPIACDPNRVRQIIWNLLTNAVKFTPAGGRVWVNVSRHNDLVKIVVQDTGQGIPPQFVPDVFGRFLQADSSTARQHGGLGLGLAITKHLVELHGGTIRAASRGENRGATFIVRLPVYAAETAPEPRAAVAGRRPPGTSVRAARPAEEVLSGMRVLVVDDDPDSCELAGRILRQAGAEVRLANSAEQGFETLMEIRPDVLISDISMPGQDGYAFIRKVRSCGGWCTDLVCVALTALARPEDRQNVLRSGYDEYVAKPFDARALPVLVFQLTDCDRKTVEARARHPHEPTRIMHQHQREPGRPGHILLAEDNNVVSEMLRLFLESSGYRVTVAPTVHEAVAAVNREPVDLLLSDFRLKDGTGWDLLEKIKAIRPVPGVMLSGYSDKFYIDRSKAVGFSHYLVKPVDEEQLVETIRQTLDGR